MMVWFALPRYETFFWTGPRRTRLKENLSTKSTVTNKQINKTNKPCHEQI